MAARKIAVLVAAGEIDPHRRFDSAHSRLRRGPKARSTGRGAGRRVGTRPGLRAGAARLRRRALRGTGPRAMLCWVPRWGAAVQRPYWSAPTFLLGRLACRCCFWGAGVCRRRCWLGR
jgi:hypothetical protein